MFSLAAACFLTTAAFAGEANPFFVFDNGVGRGTLSPPEQAQLVKDVGFDGISYNTTDDLDNRLAAFEGVGLKIYALYIQGFPQGSPRYEAGLPDAIRRLKGKGTDIWLTIRKGEDQTDADAVNLVREVADMAAQSNVRVVIYPHVGFYVADAEHALRIAKAANRDNVGVTFNLCHELMVGNQDRLEEIIRKCASKLFLVSINGADPGKGVTETIKVLGEGSVDVLGLLKTLDSVGYQGPIGLQCYNIKGDVRENLTRSMKAWKGMQAARQ